MKRWMQRVNWGAIPVVLVSLVLATLLVEYAKPDDPFSHVTVARQGSWARVDRAAEVRVNSIRTGSVLQKQSGQVEAISQGRFVVVSVSVRVDSSPTGTLRAEIRTRSGITHRTQLPLSYTPGFVVTSDVPFEVPSDDLEGAVITFVARRSMSALDRVVEVDLGLTQATIAAMPTYHPVQLEAETREVFR